jgi:LDH2 family malate/lactate/ureidoglycolate dehydrogenase
MAIDVGHFCELPWFRTQAAAAAARIRGSKRAPGVSELFAPGEPEWRAQQNANRQINLDRAVAHTLIKVAEGLQISAEPLLSL